MYPLVCYGHWVTGATYATFCISYKSPLTSMFSPSDYFRHTNEQFNLLNPTGHVMHQQFNIKQLYVLPTLYLGVLYLSENKQRLVPLTA